jgi:aminomethyltransferase
MDVSGMAVGQVRYGFLCNEQGGIVDDLTVARLGESEFLLVVNAARREVDFAWTRQHLPADIELVDRTFETAMIAVQGPDAIAVVDELSRGELKPSSKRFRLGEFDLSGVRCLISRTGYTGEDGVEIVCPSDAAERIWETLRAKGVAPCGLGARDILRLEAGLCLYGHDLSEDITPAEADLMRFVAMEKDFHRTRRHRHAIAGRHPTQAGGTATFLTGDTEGRGDSVGRWSTYRVRHQRRFFTAFEHRHRHGVCGNRVGKNWSASSSLSPR